MHHKTLVGITGGIGSGKSVVSKIIRTIGLPVYDSDLGARRLMEHDEDVKQQIIKTFGNDLYATGSLNRPLLASIVFGHNDRIETVNAIVHPAVKRDFLQWAKQQPSSVVFIESAILFESHFNNFMNHMVVVTAPYELRLQRAMNRDHATRRQVEARIEAQMAQQTLEQRCNTVLVNDNAVPLLPQVERMLKQLKA
ncbi:MAG: dephospho-CoA kinase [Bacteroidales bacterium]|nr:dephospho-CoA kinase [Bacteroidales bacterium]